MKPNINNGDESKENKKFEYMLSGAFIAIIGVYLIPLIVFYIEVIYMLVKGE